MYTSSNPPLLIDFVTRGRALEERNIVKRIIQAIHDIIYAQLVRMVPSIYSTNGLHIFLTLLEFWPFLSQEQDSKWSLLKSRPLNFPSFSPLTTERSIGLHYKSACRHSSHHGRSKRVLSLDNLDTIIFNSYFLNSKTQNKMLIHKLYYSSNYFKIVNKMAWIIKEYKLEINKI